jgi:putative transcriptional regulator
MTPTEIRALREGLGLTQTKFAERYHLTPAIVEQWENDRRHPSTAGEALLLAISRAPQTIAHILAGATEHVSLKDRP